VDDPSRAPSAAERACAWGGAGAFAASLLYFLFSYDVTFVKTVDSSAGLGAVTWNVVLFSIFALHHSVFARSGMRSAIQRRWPTLERSLYVWAASVLLVVTCVLWRPIGGDVWKIYGTPAYLLRLLHLAGIILAVMSAAAIDIWELSGVKQITDDAGSKEQDPAYDSEFKTTGPYGIVRHPIYSGWFLLVFAVPHMTMTRLVFAVVSSLYVLIAIPLEERSLAASTTGAYERYKGKVRFRLIPGIY
jgi:protein-S-isoprenylcysteine O-methyltransferase Ste14